MNGIYSFARYNHNDQSVVYTKIPSSDSSSSSSSSRSSSSSSSSSSSGSSSRSSSSSSSGSLPPAAPDVGAEAGSSTHVLPPPPAPEAEEDELEPLLTLFRCKMQNQSRWWFISNADLQSPGTDRDVDYYHRVRSVPSLPLDLLIDGIYCLYSLLSLLSLYSLII